MPPPPPQPREQTYAIPSPEQRIVVEVLNGTKRPGVARAATRLLRHRGIDVVSFGNAEDAADSTHIIVRRGDPGQGRQVQRALGAGTVVVELDTIRRVDVTVVLGQDFRAKE